MVKTELFRINEDGVILVQTKSTDNKMLLQVETSLEMPDPIDVGERYFDEKAFEVKYKPKFYKYIEIDKDIPVEVEE